MNNAKTSVGEGTGSLEKALDVLEAIGASPAGLSQTELAERLQLPRTTVYRLLATLVARGVVRRDPLAKVYRLGVRCFEMARQAFAMPDIVAAAAMELRAIRDLTGETSYFATLDGREVISLDRCDGAHTQRSAASMGQRKPLHCTSQGKAILSAMPDEQRDAIVRDLVLKPMTEFTITDRRRLQVELRITRTRGYAIDDEEIVMGVRCIGAPVVDSSGKVRGAISVAGPAYRLTRKRLELLGPEIAEAARRVGAQLPVEAAGQRASEESNIRAASGPWAFHGAFPTWSADGKQLWWADVLAPSIHLWTDGEDREFLSCEEPVTGLLLRRDGRLLVLHANGAIHVSSDGQSSTIQHWPRQTVQAVCSGHNDAVWAAVTLPESGSAIGLIGENGQLEICWRIGEPVQSLAWSPLNGDLYATAPESGVILIFTPGHANVRRLATVPKGSGRISGLALDPEGGIWTALFDGWSVMRFGEDGQVDRVLGLPVPCATGLAIGGKQGRQIMITTSRHSVALDTLASAPWSGLLLQADY